ncbi:MAG: hypothetical protein IPL26_19725 [Leptospiraceae bacterium]|nr:hypothetical protein [Leptospiraceae bacterium]
MNDLFNTIRQSVSTDWTVGSYPLSNVDPLSIVRQIQFLLYGMFLMFVFYSCSSAPTKVPNKLDLTEERNMIEDSEEIPKEQKTVILRAFDKADSVNESVRVYARQLEEQNAKLKKDLESEKEDASSYRKWRFWVLATLAVLALWHTRNWWLPVVRRLLGSPV